jgi:hypothetical protein
MFRWRPYRKAVLPVLVQKELVTVVAKSGNKGGQSGDSARDTKKAQIAIVHNERKEQRGEPGRETRDRTTDGPSSMLIF